VLDPHVSVTSSERNVLEVEGINSDQIGELAAANGIVLHELVPLQASLEQAFMELTRDDVEYKSLGVEIEPQTQKEELAA
jgi:ABC-2 type transport system ATP-binding protein